MNEAAAVIHTLYSVSSSPQIEYTIQYALQHMKPVHCLGRTISVAPTIGQCQEGIQSLEQHNTDEWLMTTRTQHGPQKSRQQRRNIWRQILDADHSLCGEVNLMQRRSRGQHRLDQELSICVSDIVAQGKRVLAVVDVHRLRESYLGITLASKLSGYSVKKFPLI
jgi:hypothetical protein